MEGTTLAWSQQAQRGKKKLQCMYALMGTTVCKRSRARKRACVRQCRDVGRENGRLTVIEREERRREFLDTLPAPLQLYLHLLKELQHTPSAAQMQKPQPQSQLHEGNYTAQAQISKRWHGIQCLIDLLSFFLIQYMYICTPKNPRIRTPASIPALTFTRRSVRTCSSKAYSNALDEPGLGSFACLFELLPGVIDIILSRHWIQVRKGHKHQIFAYSHTHARTPISTATLLCRRACQADHKLEWNRRDDMRWESKTSQNYMAGHLTLSPSARSSWFEPLYLPACFSSLFSRISMLKIQQPVSEYRKGGQSTDDLRPVSEYRKGRKSTGDFQSVSEDRNGRESETAFNKKRQNTGKEEIRNKRSIQTMY